MRPHVLAALVVVLLTAGQQKPVRQEPTFKSGASTVAVFATVQDPGGRLVPDLKQEDFEVYDNGKRQTLTIFANDIQPITVVMMLDRSGSMVANFDLVRDAAAEFVRQLLPADKARIGSFADRIQVDPRQFTGDKSALSDILQTELQEAGPTPLWNAVNVGITALLHQDGRRVVLVFTDGMDRPMNMSPNNQTLKGVMKAAEEEDVMVYAIGLAGHDAMPFGRPSGGGYGGWPRGRPGYGGGGYGRGAVDRPDPGLAELAGQTGGGYFELTSTSDLKSTFARVADELHHQYAMAFTPEKLDGKMHKLEVRLKNPSLNVRARRSYLARKEE
jgi:Ca-activated chloride channel homolog